jgi:hypothetical protein
MQWKQRRECFSLELLVTGIGFEAVTPVVMKTALFWDITP